jgi:hypothetical protein
MLNTTLLLILLCGVNAPSSFCSCRWAEPRIPREEVQADLKTAGAVFVGHVTSITDSIEAVAPEPRSLALGIRKVVLRVDSLWKGPATDSLIVVTGTGGGDCGYPFRIASSYLVFAVASQSAIFSTGMCSLTQDRSTADEYVAALGAPTVRRRS